MYNTSSTISHITSWIKCMRMLKHNYSLIGIDKINMYLIISFNFEFLINLLYAKGKKKCGTSLV